MAMIITMVMIETVALKAFQSILQISHNQLIIGPICYRAYPMTYPRMLSYVMGISLRSSANFVFDSSFVNVLVGYAICGACLDKLMTTYGYVFLEHISKNAKVQMNGYRIGIEMNV